MNILTRGITPKKVHRNNVNFGPSKLHRKNTWNERGFFDHRNLPRKGTRKRRGFFNQGNYIDKVHGHDVEVRQNLVFDITV